MSTLPGANSQETRSSVNVLSASPGSALAAATRFVANQIKVN